MFPRLESSDRASRFSERQIEEIPRNLTQGESPPDGRASLCEEEICRVARRGGNESGIPCEVVHVRDQAASCSPLRHRDGRIGGAVKEIVREHKGRSVCDDTAIRPIVDLPVFSSPEDADIVPELASLGSCYCCPVVAPAANRIVIVPDLNNIPTAAARIAQIRAVARIIHSIIVDFATD